MPYSAIYSGVNEEERRKAMLMKIRSLFYGLLRSFSEVFRCMGLM